MAKKATVKTSARRVSVKRTKKLAARRTPQRVPQTKAARKAPRPVPPTPRIDLPPVVPPAPTGSRTPAEGKAQPITDQDYGEFRTLLVAERDRLLHELTAMGQQLRQVEELGLVEQSSEDDYGDVATETFEREKGFALETSVQGMLRMVEDALRKLDAGTYGICERCGQPIDVERLRALPFARLCIRCKTEEERERQQSAWR
jgi:RNA polymerase-binding protein DksA